MSVKLSIKHILSIAALLGCAAVASTAQAHAKLESSDPKAGSTLDSAPRTVRMTFNEALEPAFSKVAIVDAANTATPLTHVEIDKANPKVMSATLPPLRPGQYKIQWSTVTNDGHKVKGEFGFSVK